MSSPAPEESDSKNSTNDTNILQEWLDGYIQSDFYRRLPEEEQVFVPEIIDDFSYYMWFYHGCFPENWTQVALEKTLLIDYPRSIIHGDVYITSVPLVLTGFFSYLESLPHIEGMDILYKKLLSISDKYETNMDESKYWGPKKAFTFLALAAGVTSTEENALYNFVYRFIQNQAPGKDEQTILSLAHVLYYWLFPFSDSRQLALLDPDVYRHCATIIGSMMRYLVIKLGIPPLEWTGSDISRCINEHLLVHPETQDQYLVIIPILTSFFSFLSENELQPQANEIFQGLSVLNS